jgi:hypothetical protein
MFFGTAEIVLDRERFDRLGLLILKNAVVEDAVLHARNLCDVFLDIRNKKDDIILSEQFEDYWDDTSKYWKLKDAISRLRKKYHEDHDGDGPSSYRAAFNKLVMHTTKQRGVYGVYNAALSDLLPLFREIVSEIKSLKEVRFPPIE